MIKLDYVRVVQFYLSEKEELQIEEITGIFGPNAVGKSAFLDAIQIVMMGANQNSISFNAQADEKTKRTLRSYCLGQYGQGDQRAREYATTYITLVWRDTETNKHISTGVCIYAAANEEKHKVLGRYVAPGVNLLLSDHLEVIGDIEQPMEWSSFRLLLQRKSESLTGVKDVFYEDGKAFVVGLLTELRGSMGRIPQYEAFTRSFKFAMRMRFDKPIDHIVRYDILENRPTNTGKFREITNAFKSLRELVAKVSFKIESGNKVIEQYKSVRKCNEEIAAWKAMSGRVNQAIATNNYETLQDDYDVILDKLKTESNKRTAALAALKKLEEKIETEYSKMVSHTSHKDFGRAENDKVNAEEKKKEAIKSIQQLFSDASTILKNVSSASIFSGFVNDINKIEKQLLNTSALSEFEQDECVSILERLSSLSKQLSEFLLNGPMRDKALEINSIDEQMMLIRDNISRLNTGKADLRQETSLLVSELSSNGLSPVPVCDLVRVTDPKWQPVIEAYLANNVEALLLPQDEEELAFRLYRSIDSRRNIYNVKVVRSRNYQLDHKQPPKLGSVAELIVGENRIAVTYLRSQFGNLMRAKSDVEALSSESTLTTDGMLYRRGAFERLKLIQDHQLKIGIKAEGRLQQLKSTLKQLETKRIKLDQENNNIRQFNNQLTSLCGEFLPRTLKASLLNFNEANAQIEVSSSILSNLTDSDYRSICEIHKDLKNKLPQAKELERTLSESVTRFDEQRKQSEKNILQAKVDMSSATDNVSQLESDVDYNNEKGQEFWDRLINKFDVEYKDMHSHIENKLNLSEASFRTILANASRSFGEFLVSNDDSPSDEIRDNWKLSEEWLTKELTRLEQTELQKYQEEATEAYKSAQDTFCTDVASILYENFNRLEDQFRRLTRTLDNCPTFSNGERYRFRYELRPRFKELHRYVSDVATYGPQNDLLGGPGEMPAEFDALINDKATASTSSLSNPLDDYREFYDFDIEIRREDPVTNDIKIIGSLSDRLGTASGGEHRAPLYVIAGAALASAYRIDNSNNDGLRLILLDEAFDKMSMNNLVATMRYFEDLGLQVLLASPGENKGALDAFLHRYYDVLRDPSNQTVYFEGHDISIETRLMMRADLPEFHPELIEQEMQVIMTEQSKAILHG